MAGLEKDELKGMCKEVVMT